MNSETPTVQTDKRSDAVPTAYVIIGSIVVLALGIAVIVGVVWLANTYPDQIEAIRDIFIVALAMESCFFGILLLLMLVMLIRLVNTIEFEIKPILEQTNETIGTVRGTTRFVSSNVVQPVVRAKSYASGVRRGVQALFGDPKKNLPD